MAYLRKTKKISKYSTLPLPSKEQSPLCLTRLTTILVANPPYVSTRESRFGFLDLEGRWLSSCGMIQFLEPAVLPSYLNRHVL